MPSSRRSAIAGRRSGHGEQDRVEREQETEQRAEASEQVARLAARPQRLAQQRDVLVCRRHDVEPPAGERPQLAAHFRFAARLALDEDPRHAARQAGKLLQACNGITAMRACGERPGGFVPEHGADTQPDA